MLKGLVRIVGGIVSSLGILVGLLLISPFNLLPVGIPITILGLYGLKRALF